MCNIEPGDEASITNSAKLLILTLSASNSSHMWSNTTLRVNRATKVAVSQSISEIGTDKVLCNISPAREAQFRDSFSNCWGGGVKN